MATAFRDWPWPLQALLYVGLAVVLIAAGLYVPGLPLTTVRTQLEPAQAEVKPLETDVQICEFTSSAAPNCRPKWTPCKSSSQRCKRSFREDKRDRSSSS